MRKIAVVGEDDSVRGFGGSGVSVFPVENTDRAGEVLDELRARGYSLVFLTENFAASLLDKIDDISAKGTNVCLIPSRGKRMNITAARIRRMTARAVGTDMEEEALNTD